jgi:hypothetical protein
LISVRRIGIVTLANGSRAAVRLLRRVRCR